MAFNHIAVIGAGAWGTALALTCLRAGRSVTLWERDPGNAQQLKKNRESLFLPGTRIDERIAIASELAEALAIPANTLSFHLKTLSHAGLVHSRQKSRFIYYSANYRQMSELLGFLTENCCGGLGCLPLGVARKRKAS